MHYFSFATYIKCKLCYLLTTIYNEKNKKITHPIITMLSLLILVSVKQGQGQDLTICTYANVQ